MLIIREGKIFSLFVVLCLSSIFLIALSSCSTSDSETEREMITVKPVPINDVLRNPHMGFTTFHAYDGELPESSYPHCSIMYFRKYWREIEPTRGNILFSLFDDILSTAQNHEQTVAFRIMAADDISTKVPDWLINLGIGGTWYDNGYGGEAFMPDFDDPIFLEETERLITTLGQRYNGHTAIDHVDIGLVGAWGEWHVFEASQFGAQLPSETSWKRYIDMHLNAFPDTKTVMLVGDTGDQGKPLHYAISKGSGWRADCLGCMIGSWNHMDDFYPQRIIEAGATDVWKTAPVAFETGGDLAIWKQYGFTVEDVTEIFTYALDYHISIFNPKSTPIPVEYRPAVDDFLKKTGYRLIIRELSHPESVNRGDHCNVKTQWENIGVAPPYHHYSLNYRLRNAAGGIIQNKTSLSAQVTSWLPGTTYNVEDTIPIPQEVASGNYFLDLSLLWEQDLMQPFVQLGIQGKRNDGWYELSLLTIQ